MLPERFEEGATLKGGFDDYLTKPYDLTFLGQRLAALLRRAPRR